MNTDNTEYVHKEYSILSNLKFIIKEAWKYDKSLYAAFIFLSFISALIPYINLFIPKILLSALLENQGVMQIMRLIVYIAACVFLLDFFSSWISSIYSRKNGLMRIEYFSSNMMKKIFRIRYADLENPNIQNNIDKARLVYWSNRSGIEGTLENLKMLVGGFLLLCGVIIICADLNLAIPFIIMGSSIINMLLTNRAKKTDATMRDKNSPLDREMQYLQENMCSTSLAKDIRIFALKDWIKEKYLKCMGNRLENDATIRKKYAVINYVAAILSMLSNIIIYLYLISGILNGSLRIDYFVMYLGAVSTLSSAFMTVVNSGTNIAQFTVYISDYRNVMDMPEEYDSYIPQESAAKSTITDSDTVIEFDEVTYRYPGSPTNALECINFKIRRGENIALIGLNGSGKSTVVKLLTGMLKPDSGRILIDGKNSLSYAKDELFKKFSAVFQDIYQYAFTLSENITFEDSKKINPDNSGKSENLEKSIIQSGLYSVVDLQPKGKDVMLRKDFASDGIDLSGGQAQSLALARALYKNGSIVVLDEPTAALDPLAERNLYERFNELMKNKTSVFISHRLASTQFCDRILVIDSGRITENGTHGELLEKKGLYAEMYTSQSKFYQ